MPPRRTSFFQTCLGVFQGGGCRAAAFAGAYEAATSRGVHFAAVAGTSAGSITAALIGAGASPKTLDGMLHELDFQRFVASPAERTVGGGLPLALRLLLGSIPTRRFRHLLLRQGMYSSRSIEDWLDVKLRELLGIRNRRVVFSDLVLPTWVVATDIVTRKVKVWSQEETPNDEVARAVRASCSIPFFFQPVGNRYVDGGALSNLPAFVFPPYRRPLARRVLAFSLVSDDEGSETENTFNLIGAIMSTVVDGAEDLQLKVQPDVHVISISTGSVKATDFDKMTPSIIDDLIARGAETTHQFFDDELAKVHAPPPPPDVVCTGTDETYTRIVENLDRQIDEILIAEETAQWIYPLFPAFLYWRAHGTRVRVVLRESMRRRPATTSTRGGCSATWERTSVPCRAFRRGRSSSIQATPRLLSPSFALGEPMSMQFITTDRCISRQSKHSAARSGRYVRTCRPTTLPGRPSRRAGTTNSSPDCEP